MDNKELFEKTIILIGPSGAGKSSVAEELQKMTGMPRLSLDGVANRARREGFTRNFRSADEFNNYMIRTLVQKAMIEGRPGIVDFGAGHSVYDDENIFRGIKEILSDFKNIVLLLPTPDIESSLEIMAKRSTGDYSTNEKFLRSHCNKDLATMTIYENGRTPKQIAESIIRTINDRNMQEAYEKSTE